MAKKQPGATAEVASDSRKRASNPARGSKKGERRGGRQKGTPNLLTADVKGMILGALNAKGGQEYLEKQAENNPVAFMTLLGKVLPKEITGANGDPLMPASPATIVINGVAPKP